MPIDAIPIWTLFAGTIIVVMVAIEAGYRLGHAEHGRSEDEKESPVSAIAGTILGLAAFMLAFTFGIVSERYDAKRGLVREDAIAIRTAWQRSDFLPEGDRAEAAALLRQYVDTRVKFAEERNVDPERVKNVLSETQRLQDRLWNMAVANEQDGAGRANERMKLIELEVLFKQLSQIGKFVPGSIEVSHESDH
jgi:hypothetical protein